MGVLRYGRIGLRDLHLLAGKGAPRGSVEALLAPAGELAVPAMAFGDVAAAGLPIPPMARAAWQAGLAEQPATHLWRIANAVVHPPHGIVTVDDRAIEESLHGVPFGTAPYTLTPTAITVPEPAALVGLERGFHGLCAPAGDFDRWMLDGVGRLHVAPFGPPGFHGVVLLPPMETPAQRAILALLADGPCPLLPMGQGHAVACRALTYVPNAPAGASIGASPGAATLPVFDRLRALLAPDGTGKPGRLYLARPADAEPALANERAVRALVRRHGFRPVVPAELPLAEQARLFAGATHIVAPCDAGLANLLFCPPGTAVLELQRGAALHWRFRHLAALRGLRYGCLVGPEATPRQAAGWTVPPDRLAATLADPAFAA